MPDPSEISQITTTDGVTHDIKDATARNTKVNKSGDTMTGQLVAQNNIAYSTSPKYNKLFIRLFYKYADVIISQQDEMREE